MPLSSAIGSLPYPALGDVPNAQTAGAALTAAVDLVSLPQFTSDAAVTAAIPAPANGQRICRTDVGQGAVAVWSSALSRWVYEHALISETTLGADAATITLSSIPQKWSHLRLILNGRAGTSTSTHKYGMEVFAALNGDTTTTNYSFTDETRLDKLISGNTTYGVSTVDASSGSTTSAPTNPVSKTGFTGDVGARLGVLPGESSPASMWGTIESDIFDYAALTATDEVEIMSRAGASVGGAGAYWLSGRDWSSWNGAVPITSIVLGMFSTGKFKAGTHVRLYGWS